MATITHQVGIKSSPEEIFQALTTIEGLAKWWTSDTCGNCSTGGKIEFYFNTFKTTFEVIKLRKNERVRWRCTLGDSQWLDTEIVFELCQDKKQTFVNFKHDKWKSATELFTHCNTKWAVFMLSLKELIETGKGRPFPDDIHVNHS